MSKTIEHCLWPDAPDMWMPFAPAIKARGGTTVYLAGCTVGANCVDVVTCGRFVTDLSDQDALNRVWARPATTTVQVMRLAADPRCLVEINAVAVID